MSTPTDPSSPWHAGEKQLQTRVGVAERMEEFGRRVIHDYLPEQHRDFYRQLPFVLMGTVGLDSTPWATLIEGTPGFAHSPDPRTLNLDSLLQENDPAASALQQGAAVGLLGIELHSRRRNRLNGHIQHLDAQGLSVAVDQAFGNCPQYIQRREFQLLPSSILNVAEFEDMDHLDEQAVHMIKTADTFFVASYITQTDGTQSVDVSHRGGKPGFIRINGNRLSIPDFAGNLHFNTLGNLLVNPRAGLLFIDFENGDLLQLSGRTELALEGDEISAFQGAERIWHVDIERVVRRKSASRLRWQLQDYSPNSLMTGSWEEAQARQSANALREQWRPLRVTRIEQESSTIRSLYLEPADTLGWPTYKAGQHLPIRLQIPGESKPVVRTYSLSSAPSDTFLRISVKYDGVASRFLHEKIEVGSIIEAKAAQGHFTLDPDQRRPVVLLGAGIGASPLLGMLREVLYQNLRLRRNRVCWWIQSTRHLPQLAFADELHALESKAGTNIRSVRAISQPDQADREGVQFDYTGHINIALLKSILPLDDYDFYLCGPSQFTQEMYDSLRALNISDHRIHAESFGPSSLRRKLEDNPSGTMQPGVATTPVPVLFQRSQKEARWQPESGNLLELAEARGLNPEFSCRTGVCGSCKTRIVSGSVAYFTTPAATIEPGTVLICCAKPAAGNAPNGPIILDL